MNINRDLSEIRAEVLLNYLYPEMEEQWTVHYEGAFYRNYNGDPMSINETTKEIRLSRDGFLRLLPQGLLTYDEELKGEDTVEKFKRMEQRQRILHEAFLPFDTFSFQKSLAIERQTSELLNDKLHYVLKEYFNFDLARETDTLVQEAAVLLPFVCRYKGDLGFVSNLLAALMKCKVNMRVGRYSQTDTTVSWLPQVIYELLIPNLTAKEYQERCEALKPLISFLKEWLIPFDVHCEVFIKEHKVNSDIGGRLTLNYNTEIIQ